MVMFLEQQQQLNQRMNIFNKLQGQYQQLWKTIVRPTRTPYPESALGPETFTLENKKVKRIDFQLINPRRYVFYVSHFVPMEQQNYPCVIYMHGNSSNRTEGMEYLGELIRNNISLCTFDFSGCGNSEGEYVTLGYYQWQDLHEVVEWIRHKQKVTKIGIWGRSMGAVTGLLYLKKSEHVAVGVFDSPFKSLKHLVEDLVQKNSKIPKIIVSGALKIISGTIQQKAKFDIYKLNPLKYETPFLQFPAFFIVGKDDQLIPYTHTEELYNSYRGKDKQIRIVAGGHNDQRPDQSIKDIIQFLVTHLNNKKSIDRVEWEPGTISPNQQKKQNKINEIDFFSDNFEKRQEQHIQNHKELYNIDFFAEQVSGKPKEEKIIFQKQQKIQKHLKTQKTSKRQIQVEIQVEKASKQKPTDNSSSFSFSSMLNSVVNKAKSIYSNTNNNQKIQKDDGYDQMRNQIKNKYVGEQSDLREKHKMYKINGLAKIKHQQMAYENYAKENADKIETWIFK